MITNLLQKHWEWQENRKENCDARSLEVQDDVRGQHGRHFGVRCGKTKEFFPNNRGDQHVHGWITAGLPREIAALEGRALFEHVESKFQFTRCIRQESVEAPRLWLKMVMQIVWNVKKEWKREMIGTSSNVQLQVGGLRRRTWSR